MLQICFEEDYGKQSVQYWVLSPSATPVSPILNQICSRESAQCFYFATQYGDDFPQILLNSPWEISIREFDPGGALICIVRGKSTLAVQTVNDLVIVLRENKYSEISKSISDFIHASSNDILGVVYIHETLDGQKITGSLKSFKYVNDQLIYDKVSD